MRKYLFIFVLLLTFLIASPANAQTNSNKEAIKELNNRITEIEEEIEELSNVDDLKSEMNDSLLNREKSLSDDMYSFLIAFVAIVSLFATAGGIILGYLVNRLGKHQKKIDLVLDSKDFDEKVTAIEQRLAAFRMRERLNEIAFAKREFKSICKRIDGIVEDINYLKKDNLMDKHTLNEILSKYEWSYLLETYQEEIKNFKETKDIEISSEDDNELDYTNVEEELVSIIKEMEMSLDNFEKVNKEIGDTLMADN
ncbi:hypothetical protein [Anaerobacillus sp. 1_MG-2023]|uniref:hypothetical protein n=1 Tax=Anaerobacillus sp. 1_MG-2023 TaxID=3062655 RepID=UPI0026E3B24D|nr:hypothetical protein [Anaerobacillus sp. 1_MG-2023]MDO6658678.1 hypothetical protein [Anaerobacillus sp. 1_MG-2023]